jgi:hypothetical protein
MTLSEVEGEERNLLFAGSICTDVKEQQISRAKTALGMTKNGARLI